MSTVPKLSLGNDGGQDWKGARLTELLGGIDLDLHQQTNMTIFDRQPLGPASYDPVFVCFLANIP